jgi:hypothetical protein
LSLSLPQNALAHCESSPHAPPLATGPFVGKQLGGALPEKNSEHDRFLSSEEQAATRLGVADVPGAARPALQSGTARALQVLTSPYETRIVIGAHASYFSQAETAMSAQASSALMELVEPEQATTTNPENARAMTSLELNMTRLYLTSMLLVLGGACSRSGGPADSAPNQGPAVAASPASPITAPIDASAQALADASAIPPEESSERARLAAAAEKNAAAELLYPSGNDAGAAPSCADVPCLLTARYAADEKAKLVALDLFARTGTVAGLEVEHIMNGGYRGMLHLVPELPIDRERPHLERVAGSLFDFDKFFGALETDGGAKVSYRWRRLALRFFRSVRARTPSAYAVDWTVAYNLSGSLNGSADSVRETMFHEIFHLNDAAHGKSARDWSNGAVGSIYDAIVAKCGARTACLTPYSPNATMVRGGTFYSFQPGNDVREYAAELAVRYYREQRGMLGQGARVTPSVKCGPPENARAWRLFVAEFFGDIDRTPPCP